MLSVLFFWVIKRRVCDFYITAHESDFYLKIFVLCSCMFVLLQIYLNAGQYYEEVLLINLFPWNADILPLYGLTFSHSQIPSFLESERVYSISGK
jgi:hypothetical protein